jgi:hypothetical protein
VHRLCRLGSFVVVVLYLSHLLIRTSILYLPGAVTLSCCTLFQQFIEIYKHNALCYCPFAWDGISECCIPAVREKGIGCWIDQGAAYVSTHATIKLTQDRHLMDDV